jgi:hypothetical protein
VKQFLTYHSLCLKYITHQHQKKKKAKHDAMQAQINQLTQAAPYVQNDHLKSSL